MTEEEEFEDLERRLALARMAKVRDSLAEHDRNVVLEEVAQAIEKFKGAFGQDTCASFAVYVRSMKR